MTLVDQYSKTQIALIADLICNLGPVLKYDELAVQILRDLAALGVTLTPEALDATVHGAVEVVDFLYNTNAGMKAHEAEGFVRRRWPSANIPPRRPIKTASYTED